MWKNSLKKKASFVLAIFFTGGLIFQVAWYAMLWGNLIRNEEILRRTDFIIFYIGGKIAAEISPTEVYDLDLQFQQQTTLVGVNFDP